MRAHIRSATSISVAFDESNGRKLVRMRCDMPVKPYRFNGVMGVLSKSFSNTGKATVKDAVMEDHAKIALESLERFHKKFFTVGLRKIVWDKALKKRKKRKVSDSAVSDSVVSSQSLATSSVAGQVDAPRVARERRRLECVRLWRQRGIKKGKQQFGQNELWMKSN